MNIHNSRTSFFLVGKRWKNDKNELIKIKFYACLVCHQKIYMLMAKIYGSIFQMRMLRRWNSIFPPTQQHLYLILLSNLFEPLLLFVPLTAYSNDYKNQHQSWSVTHDFFWIPHFLWVLFVSTFIPYVFFMIFFSLLF